LKLRDIDFQLHDDEMLSNAIRRDGDFYEAEILDYLRDHHPVQQFVIDVGANIGNHTVYFANFLSCEMIFALEPIPENYKLLRKNSCLYKNVLMLPIAVSSGQGPIRMTIDHQNTGASYVDQLGSLTVDGFSLDYLMGRWKKPVTLMRIDVEWHEPEVLAGAKNLIKQWKPLVLVEDTKEQYGKLLPEYHVEKAWPNHRTYLLRAD
jgi:FkbM family methyltransferase